MATKTYYTVLDADGNPTVTQYRKMGTSAYGYATLAQAKKRCPAGWHVQERHTDGNDDWAGRVVWVNDPYWVN